MDRKKYIFNEVTGRALEAPTCFTEVKFQIITKTNLMQFKLILSHGYFRGSKRQTIFSIYAKRRQIHHAVKSSHYFVFFNPCRKKYSYINTIDAKNRIFNSMN